MNYAPEFIRLMKDIRDHFFQRMKTWRDEITVMEADIKKIYNSFMTMGVDKTHTLPPDAQNIPADARVTYDPITERFTFWIPQGAKGVDGQMGQEGPRGIAGPTGLQGSTGVRGPQGIEGPTGPRGVNGLHGAQGVIGPKGDTGDKGAIGAPGSDGSIGKTGAQGAQGVQGPVGPTGPHGPQGIRGMGLEFKHAFNTLADLKVANPNPEIGETHLVLFQADGITEKGDLYVWDNPVPPHNPANAGWNDIGHIRGPQGVKGNPGPTGPIGPGVKILGAASAADIAKKSGTLGDLWIDSTSGNAWVYTGSIWKDVGPFKGPKGDPGPVGPRGATGTAGANGQRGQSVKILGTDTNANILARSGTDGDIWIDSATGNGLIHDGTKWNDIGPIRGPKGSTGAVGHQGIEGKRGAIGPIGPDGPAGPTGKQGHVGIAGPQGTQGPKGDIGPRGQQGAAGAVGSRGPAGATPSMATQAETKAGVINNKAVSPFGLKTLIDKFNTLASKYVKIDGSSKMTGTLTTPKIRILGAASESGLISFEGHGIIIKGNGSGKNGQIGINPSGIALQTKAGTKVAVNGREILTTANGLAKTGGTLTGATTFPSSFLRIQDTGSGGYLQFMDKTNKRVGYFGKASPALDDLTIAAEKGNFNITVPASKTARVNGQEILTVANGLTITSAAATYQTKSGMSGYLTKTSAASMYALKTAIPNISGLETKAHAIATYALKTAIPDTTHMLRGTISGNVLTIE